MDSMEEKYGYDANFIGEVLDLFKCSVCHLVLRQPVQIITCGHHFCKPCFERLECYSKHLNTVLCCPIDREVVDVHKVFESTGISREIGNLQVKCSSFNEGCFWQGDLRSLQDHEKDCQYKIKIQHEQKAECEKENGLIKDLIQRVQKCEQSLSEKEKELAHVKYDIDEMKSISERKEKELDSLQTLNTELQNEVKVMKILREEMKSHFEKEIIELKYQNKILDTKVNSLEARIIENKNGFKEVAVGEMLEKQMEEMKIDMANELSAGNHESVQLQIEESLLPLKNELAQVEKDQQKTFDEVRAVKNDTEETLIRKSNEIKNITTRVEAAENLLENVNAKKLTTHIENIENVLFRCMPYVEKEIKFQWVFTDYNYHFEKGEVVSSPMFYPQLNGYCFKLFVHWTGTNKEHFGCYLKLCRGKNVDEDLESFRIEYELAVLCKDGTYKTCRVTLSGLEIFKDSSFTILPNQQEANGCGFSEMFTNQVEDYVINDSVHITCTFKLS